MLKYFENELDRKLRLAREDEAKIVTEKVTEEVTEEVTEKVTEKVTEEVTEKVTENIACNLLRDNQDVSYVHKISGLPVSRINELKANL